MTDNSQQNHCFGIIEQSYFYEKADELNEYAEDDSPDSPWSYGVRMGRVPISLSNVEYRILKFLSAKPYHPFTPRRIADAATSKNFPITEETLRQHILSLREKLGIFSDYIQTVPDVGYRFKA